MADRTTTHCAWSCRSRFSASYEKAPAIEKSILNKIEPIMRGVSGEHITSVLVVPLVTGDTGWQNKAKAWLAGQGVSNQGRVRSDNIASRSFDGLLFRYQPEIDLYQALKAIGVSFAPLPVFIRGGKTYRRIEPDFVILKSGLVMAVEVDGDTVRPRNSCRSA